MIAPDTLVSQTDAAETMGCTPNYIISLRARHGFPCPAENGCPCCGRPMLRYRVADLLAWAASHPDSRYAARLVAGFGGAS